MRDCAELWLAYMDRMAVSRRARDPIVRRLLIVEAYILLDRYFLAVEHELARNVRIA